MIRFRRRNYRPVLLVTPVLLGLLWISVFFGAGYPSSQQREIGRAFGFGRVAEGGVFWLRVNQNYPLWLQKSFHLTDEQISEDAAEVFDEAREVDGIPDAALPKWSVLFLAVGDQVRADQALAGIEADDEVVFNQRRLVRLMLAGEEPGEPLVEWAKTRYHRGESELPEWYFLAQDNRQDGVIGEWMDDRGRNMVNRGIFAELLGYTILLWVVIKWILWALKRFQLPRQPAERLFFAEWEWKRALKIFFIAEFAALIAVFILSWPLFFIGFYDEGLIVGGLAIQVVPLLFLIPVLTPGIPATLRLFGLRRPEWSGRQLLSFGVIGLGLAMLVAFGISLVGSVSMSIGDVVNSDYLDRDLAVLWVVIASVVVAPICEELLMRGFLFSILRGPCGAIAAAILSSVLFGFLHGYSLVGFLSTTSLGLVFCWMYQRSGSLWPGVIAHSLFNLCVTSAAVGWYSFH
tara:strand:- start:72 stop:1454 length:1383 start_codon:yes stop_codon:yes gene_type:complete